MHALLRSASLVSIIPDVAFIQVRNLEVAPEIDLFAARVNRQKLMNQRKTDLYFKMRKNIKLAEL